MATTKTLHDAFIDELRDIYDAEQQIAKALPKLIAAAHDGDLREGFESHLEETKGHARRVEQVLTLLGEKVSGKHCDGVAGILQEGKKTIDDSQSFDDDAADAMLIAAAQRVEHYEIAVYGNLIAWAKAMDHTEAADLLRQNRDEEKAANEKMTSLGEGGINKEAAAIAHPADEEREPAMAGSHAGTASDKAKAGAGKRGKSK